MTARILVVGSDAADPATVEAVLQKAYLTLRPEAGHVLLLTVTDSAAETVAVNWWRSHGMVVEPVRRYRNKYITLNNVIRYVVPDLVLIFGDTNLCLTAITRCKNGGIRWAHVGAS